MQPQEDTDRIEAELLRRLAASQLRYRQAADRFDAILAEIKAGTAPSDSAVALQQAGRERGAAFEEYSQALREFSGFPYHRPRP